MREVVSGLLDEWAPKGRIDFVDFASYFPITVMFRIVGASLDDLPGVHKSLEWMGSSFNLDPAILPDLLNAFDVLWNFTEKLIAERGKEGSDKDDLLNDLLQASASGKLSAVELRDLLIIVLVGGYDTSKNLLSMLMAWMLDRPDVWKRCAVDRAYSDKVVEEGLRYSAVASPTRTVIEAFDYRGVHFPVGTMIAFPLPLAGRDPAIYDDAFAFNPERKPGAPHLAFGRGIHFCLGMNIARAQIQEALPLIAQRITNPRAAGDPAWKPFFALWGLKSLPISFDPAPATHEAQAA
jgi:cytochrome P450